MDELNLFVFVNMYAKVVDGNSITTSFFILVTALHCLHFCLFGKTTTRFSSLSYIHFVHLHQSVPYFW